MPHTSGKQPGRRHDRKWQPDHDPLDDQKSGRSKLIFRQRRVKVEDRQHTRFFSSDLSSMYSGRLSAYSTTRKSTPTATNSQVQVSGRQPLSHRRWPLNAERLTSSSR